MLAGLARAAVTSVVYITEYETNCNVCTSSSKAAVVVAPSAVVQAASATKVAASIVATGAVVVAPSSSSSSTPVAIVAASSSSVKSAAASVSACPATAHTDALGSKNYPSVITPVSSLYPDKVYGPQYFASIGGGNSTIFTFDYEVSGTCTLQMKFPTTAQILALSGTTSYTISSSSINVTLYQLASVASPDADYADKPARGAAFSAVLTPGQNTTFTSFACPVGTSVSYELAATDSNTLSWFEDYNPPPLGLLALMC